MCSSVNLFLFPEENEEENKEIPKSESPNIPSGRENYVKHATKKIIFRTLVSLVFNNFV